MSSIGTYLIMMFMVMFWGFRVIVGVMSAYGLDFIIKPLDLNIEIIILFITIPAMILVVKRKFLGAIIYLVAYLGYFGKYIYDIVMQIMQGTPASISEYTNIFVSFLGVLLPVIAFFDLILDKNRMAHPVDKKTDWFYKNKDYDRKLDERADKNNYRTL